MKSALLPHGWILPLAALAAGLAAYAISVGAFRQTVVTTDENSYLFQAHTFLQGRLKRPCPPLAGLFRYEQIIIDKKRDAWVSRYPPGHPLWLLPGVLLGQPYAMSAVAAALTLLFTAAAARRLGGSPTVTALLALGSPYFLFTHGTLLSHTSGQASAAFMLWAYVAWRQSGGIRYALAAGLAWDFLFLNRTYTGALIAAPFGLHALAGLLRDRRRTAWLGTLAFAGAATVGVLVLLGYNYAVLGDPLAMTHTHYDPSETLGFGRRHVHGRVVMHTLAGGLSQLADNLRLMDRWLFGFPGSLIALAALAAVGWRSAWTLLLTGSTALIWIGYVWFWYPGPQDTGPGYYFESLPYLLLLASLGLARLGTRLTPFPRIRRLAALTAGCGLLAASATFSLRAAPRLSRQFQDRARLRAALRDAPPGTMVFVEADRETSRAVVFNPLGLGSQPLLFWALDGTSKPAIEYFRDRKPFAIRSGPAPGLVPVDPIPAYDAPMSAEKLRRHTGANENGARVAREGRHPVGWLALGRTRYVFPGRFAVDFDLDVERCPDGAAAGYMDVIDDDDGRVLARKELLGSRRGIPETIEFETHGFPLVAPRLYYGGRGDVTLRSIRIREAARLSSARNTEEDSGAPP